MSKLKTLIGMFGKKLILGVATLTLAMFFQGCSLKKMIQMAKQQELTVVPSPLELHGDSVKFTTSAKLPVKMLRKNKIYTVNTTFYYGEKKVEFPAIEFKYDAFPNAKTEQPVISKAFSMGYTDEMRSGEVKLKGSASAIGGKSLSTPEMPIAKGVITTPRNLVYPQFAVFAAHGYDKSEELEPNGFDFYFLKDRSDLRTSETKGVQAKKMKAFILGKKPTRKIVLTGMHSPEGSEARNGSLSELRAKSVDAYYKKLLKEIKMEKSADSLEFITKAVIQDWAAFKAAVEATKVITDEQKKEVLAVIDAPGGNFIDKELKLQSLKFYKKLYSSIYPKLRKSTAEIMTVKYKKPDALILLLAKGVADGSLKADTLTDAELAYGATLTPVVEEKEAIYKAAISKADMWASHNNLGAIYLNKAIAAATQADKNKFADMAKNHFEISKNKQNSAEANLNLASVALIKGDYLAASKLIDEALKLNPTEEIRQAGSSMQGVINIRLGGYTTAISKLNAGVKNPLTEYNLALAHLLNKDVNNAKTTVDRVIAAEPNMAWAHYLAAIVAARQDKAEDMARSLAKAISLKSELRAYAMSDLEFVKFFELPGFKEAIK